MATPDVPMCRRRAHGCTARRVCTRARKPSDAARPSGCTGRVDGWKGGLCFAAHSGTFWDDVRSRRLSLVWSSCYMRLRWACAALLAQLLRRGCLSAEHYSRARHLVLEALDFIEAHNQAIGRVPRPPMLTLEVPVFQPVATLEYPEGFPMVHPALQDRDFEVLQEGDPVFMGLNGEPRLFSRKEFGLAHNVELSEDASQPNALFPFFINEAAYYETNVAFMVAGQSLRRISAMRKEQLAEVPKL